MKEDIERLVDLLKEYSYSVPRGLTGGLTREEILTYFEVVVGGQLSLRKYAETKPTDFNLDDFIDLTNNVTEGEKCE